MKTSTIESIILYGISLILACVSVSYIPTLSANEIGVKLLTASYLTDDDTLSRGKSVGIELTYSPNGRGYIFLSKQDVRMQPIYPNFHYDITGVGVGHKLKLNKEIRLFGQIGYFNIENSHGPRVRGRNEALGYYINNRFAVGTGQGSQVFDSYGVENEDAIGGSVGIEFDYNISKAFNITTTISYTMMKFNQTIKGFKDEWDKNPNSWWESNTMLDFSSLNFGTGLRYEF
jgi:hypothetical protein